MLHEVYMRFYWGRQKREWHDANVARRPWTHAERRVVLRGFFGRLTIAIDP